MNKLINIFLLSAIILLSFTSKAYSAILNSQFITEQIKSDIKTQLKQHYNGKITVEIKSLPYKSIKVPDGEIEIKTNSNLKKLKSISIIKVNIYVDKVRVKSFGVRAELKIYDKVWVAKDWIKRGGNLNNIAFEEREISSSLSSVPGKDFEPHKYLAKRNIKPGEIINLLYVEGIPLIVKNSPVSVIFKTPLVSITIPGIAVTSGKTGDFIKVKNIRYKKNYMGKIIGKNLVLINI